MRCRFATWRFFFASVGVVGVQVGVYGYSGYAAAKFALRGMAEVLQQELCPFGIRVSLVFPPDTDTPQLAQGGAGSNIRCGLGKYDPKKTKKQRGKKKKKKKKKKREGKNEVS